jgi:uncharacterized protein
MISRDYFAACAEGRLLIQECPSCGHRQHYPRSNCTRCNAIPTWLETAGRGTVYTFTIVRQYGLPPFKEMLPYVVAMIALDEGPRLMGNISDCPPDEVSIGMSVEFYAMKISDEMGIPFWRPTR